MSKDQTPADCRLWEAISYELQRDWAVAERVARAAADPLVQGSVSMLIESRGIDADSRKVCKQALESRLASHYGLSSDQFGKVCVAAEREAAEVYGQA